MKIGRRFRHKTKLPAQQGIFRFKAQRRRMPTAQPFIFLAQPGIIAAQRPEALDFRNRVLNRIHRLGNRAIDRRKGIGQRGAEPFNQQVIRLAQQHHPEGHGNHDRQRKPRQCLP